MTDFAASRRMMVDTQVRPSDVTKYPIIDAMLAVPRELYVPATARQTAYVDDNIPLKRDRVVLAPRTLAKMLDALDIHEDELVLDVGCGLGYSTAVIARLAEAVVGVEDDEIYAPEAQGLLADEGVDNAAVIKAPLTEGAPRHGPYDVIIVQGGVEVLPEALCEQLKEGGRLCAVFQQGALGQVRLGVRTAAGALSWRWLFDGTAPVLPGFERARAFQL